jgi:hypothetical protein
MSVQAIPSRKPVPKALRIASFGVPLRSNSRRGFRVRLLAAGKTTIEERLSVLLPHPFDAVDLHEVDAMSDDVHEVDGHATVITTVLHVIRRRAD